MAYFYGIRSVRVSMMLVLLLFSAGFLFGQVGGPYTPDANTMLLMHFDGDLGNVAQYSEDGVFHGDPSNFFFLTNQVPGLGQCLRIDNDSQSDSAFVTIADTSYLDLTGDWTIEGWINIFTFGTGSSDWRWVPRLVIKTGDEVFWRPNYFVEMWGSTRFFSCGYHTASQDQWPQANSAANVMQVGTWYHMAFIRDSARHLLMTIIHEYNSSSGQIELASFTAVDYLSFGAADPTPIVTNQPVTIGYAGGGGDSFLDGFVDEIRISNVVRQYPIPPIIADVSTLPNQPTSVPQYEIGADVFTVGSTTIARAELFYSLDAGANWTSQALTTVSGDSMVGTIPGQPLGSVIWYYLEAEDNNGLIYQFPQDVGFGAADYYSFGVYQENTQTLAMTFEEGMGSWQDTSAYDNPVTTYGSPEHSTAQVAAGTYSLYLEGDSSLLEIDSPFLAASEYYVDFWVYPDCTMANPSKVYCRFFNRPRDATSWSNNNYQIRFNPDSRLYAGADGQFVITMTDSLAMDRWYHLQLEARSAPPGDTVAYYAIFRVADENDQTLEQRFIGFDTPIVPGFAPLRIGKAADRAPVPGAYPPFFKGYYDDIMVYNYAAGQLPLVTVGIEDNNTSIPLRYELAQNFPNPFNPNTEIHFMLPRSEKVSMIVYDLLGRKVATLIDASMTSGNHVALWDGRDDFGNPVASGVYFYRLQTKKFTQTKKMILMK